MKVLRVIFILTLSIVNYQLSIAQIAINPDGATPDASAMLDISSTDKGMLIPRMDSTARNNISSPATGLMVYDTDNNAFWYYNGTAWTAIGQSVFTAENNVIYANNIDSDFLIGTNSMDWNSGTEHKLLFDKSKGAFRAGGVYSDRWNETNIGNYSFVAGYDSKATKAYSAVLGANSTASGEYAVALGANAIASSDYSLAFGVNSRTFGEFSIAMGLSPKAYSYGETVIGMNNTAYTPVNTSAFDASDRLFVIGNGTGSTFSDAMIVYKSGNTEINGDLTTQSLALNNNGNTLDASAILDISSSDKGILIPRMDSTSRNNISSPATGLMVYDSTTNSFWYYANAAWNNLNSTFLADTDGDTKIQVEESSDEDIIRFDMNGTEFMRLDSGRVEIVNTGNSVFIGEGAGEKDDYSDNRNVFVGYQAGHNNDDGEGNIFTGYQAGYLNESGSNNIFIGNEAGYNETNSNRLYIENSNSSSPLIYGEFDNDILTVNGQLTATDTTTISSALFVNDNAKAHSLVLNTNNDTLDASAILDISSSDKGVLMPRMTTAERTAISSPATGLTVYDITTKTFWYYDNHQWNEVRNNSDQLEANDIFEGINLGTDFSCAGTLGTLSYNSNYEFESVAASGNYAYILDSDKNNLMVIDISDPSSPSKITTLGIGGNPSEIALAGQYAYIVDKGSNDLKIIDVSNPATPTLTGSLGIGGGPNDIKIVGNYAYVVDGGSDDIKIIDISNPTAPGLLGSLGLGYKPIAVGVSGDYAYVLDETVKDLKVINISNPVAPTLMGSVAIPGGSYSEMDDLEVSGNYAYVSDGYGNYNLYVVDVSDPTNPTFTTGLDLNTQPTSIALSGNYVYLAPDYYAGITKVIDISDPTNPTAVKDIDINNDIHKIVVSDGYAITVDGYYKFKIAKIACDNYVSVGVDPVSGGLVYSEENLGDHTADANIQLNDYYLSNDGSNKGISIDDDGNVTLSGKLTVTDSTILSNVLIVNNDTRIDGTLRTTGDLGITEGNQTATLRSDESAGYIQLDVGGASHSGDAIFIGDVSNTTNEVIMMGSVGIGTDISSGASYKLEVSGSAAKSSGSMWTTTSDRRLKSNIETYT